MKLYLTNGMFGEEIEQIGSEFSEVKTAFELIYGWKNDLDNQKSYKVEPYDRLLFHPEEKKVAIDFGDYSTFMLVTNVDKKRMDVFKGM